MKRMISIIAVLSLCLSLTSCSGLTLGVRSNPSVFFDGDILFDRDTIPDHSDNFDEDFFDSFEEDYVFASNLAYYSASEWEAEEECDHESARVRYRFSMIDGAEDKQFVARSLVNRSKFPALADVMCHLEIFRHKDAPDPMIDWTIKSVSIIALDYTEIVGNTSYETDTDLRHTNRIPGKIYITMEDLSRSYMSLYDTEERRLCTFNRESDPKLMKMIKEGYASPVHPEDKMRLELNPPNSSKNYDCYAVIRFEENENIVYYCPLYRNYESTEIYFGASERAVINEEFAVIDGDYAEKICNSRISYNTGENQ